MSKNQRLAVIDVLQSGRNLDLIRDLILTEKTFRLKSHEPFAYAFRDGQLKVVIENTLGMENSMMSLMDLMKDTVILEPWRPREGIHYWYWVWVCKPGEIGGFKASETCFSLYLIDILNAEIGNCYETKAACEADTAMRDKLIVIREKARK